MASELIVQTLKGPTSGANANKVIIPSGQTLDASSATVTVTPTAGQVVQVKENAIGTFFTLSAADVWLNPHSSVYVNITPQYADSVIIVEYEVPINPTGGANIVMTMQPTRSTDGGSTYNLTSDIGTGLGSRQQLTASWFRSNNGYDANDMQTHKFSAHDQPNTTNAVRYSFWFRQETSQNVLFNHTNNDNSVWGWTARTRIKATEIKQ